MAEYLMEVLREKKYAFTILEGCSLQWHERQSMEARSVTTRTYSGQFIIFMQIQRHRTQAQTRSGIFKYQSLLA